MLRMKKLSEIYGMKVYTDEGDYFGDLEEVIVSQTKVNSWRVRAMRGSLLSKVLGSAKGVIVPHGLVKSIGDIMVISRSAAPARPDDE
ncbi:MAG: PRC-barrel domain-containing protein [Candidatus Woesearchaeota archaeon]